MSAPNPWQVWAGNGSSYRGIAGVAAGPAVRNPTTHHQPKGADMTATVDNLETTSGDILTDDMLDRFHERAPIYDRENRFFSEDFQELKEAGYLTMSLPRDLGGRDFRLDQVAKLQRQLGYVAAPTALATNMHLYWMGTGADLRHQGDRTFDFVLNEASRGKVFAAGHGERGNDIPVLLSTATAERVEGGYRINGHKMFGSLSPVWDYIGFHAMDTGHPAGPQIIHGFMPRNTPGVRIVKTWDTLGMRATQSDDTIFEDAFIADDLIVATVPAGQPSVMLLTSLAWVEVTFASIYLGIADRALDLAVQNARKRTSLALTRSMAYHPEVQHEIAEAVLAIDTATAVVERVADEWTRGVDHGPLWLSKLVIAKHAGVEAAKKVVDISMTVSGGSGMFRSSELERLYRDVRAGGFHPQNTFLVHEMVGKLALGIDPGEQPRWG